MVFHIVHIFNKNIIYRLKGSCRDNNIAILYFKRFFSEQSKITRKFLNIKNLFDNFLIFDL